MGKPFNLCIPPFLGFEMCQLFHHLHCLLVGVFLFSLLRYFSFTKLFMRQNNKKGFPGAVPTWELKWLLEQVGELLGISQRWDQGYYLPSIFCGLAEEQP